MTIPEGRLKYKVRREPEGTDIECGIFVVLLAALIGIGAILFLSLIGVPSQMLEKGMVWLPVPWFAFWYLKCREWHRTKLIDVRERRKTDLIKYL